MTVRCSVCGVFVEDAEECSNCNITKREVDKYHDVGFFRKVLRMLGR